MVVAGRAHCSILLCIYIYIVSLCFDFSVVQCSIHKSKAFYIYCRKHKKMPPRPLPIFSHKVQLFHLIEGQKKNFASKQWPNFDTEAEKGCFKCKTKCDLCNDFIKETTHLRVSKRTEIILSNSILVVIQAVLFIWSHARNVLCNMLDPLTRNHKSNMQTSKRTCEAAPDFNKQQQSLRF